MPGWREQRQTEKTRKRQEPYRMVATASKPVWIYCPTEFFPEEFLTPDELRYGDGIAYLLHLIMRRRVCDSRYRKGSSEGHADGFVRLKAQFLQKIIGRHHWAQVKSLATGNGIVECDESYSAGRFAQGYRIGSRFEETDWERREVTDKGLHRRALTWQSNRRSEQWRRIEAGQTPVALEVCKFLDDQLRRIRIRDDAPVEKFPPAVGISVDMIRRGDWFFSVDKYGRIHTNITNLKREMRPFLTANGQSLVNLDIASSQPLFIWILYSHEAERSGGGRQGGGAGEEGRDRE